MESSRFFTSLRTTARTSRSLGTESAPPFSIAAYFTADFNMRRTESFSASRAIMAAFRSASILATRLIDHENTTDGHYGQCITTGLQAPNEKAAVRRTNKSTPHRRTLNQKVKHYLS